MNINPGLFNIGILTLFLVVNLVLIINSGENIKTLKEYALGSRKFTTTIIVASIIATWIGGSFFFTITSETYKNGLYYLWSSASAKLVYFLVIAAIFAPRVSEFIGQLSIAEAMGSIYGEKIRIITAISGIVSSLCIIAVQLKVAGMIFEYTFGLSTIYGVTITGIIVITYSTIGGIKTSTFTDLIKSCTFGFIIPIILLYLFNSLGTPGIFINAIKTSPLFDIDQIFDFSQTKSLYFLFLFVYLSIPSFSPAMFQRISMAKDSFQVMKAFTIAAVICFVLTLGIGLIGILTSFIHPGIDPKEVIKTIMVDYGDMLGFKGVLLVGVLAMIMSTVDSFLNSSSVMVVHDFLTPLKIKILENQVSSARIASSIIGLIAIALSFCPGSTFKLMIISYSFYMPIVTVPFMMTTFGFRSSPLSVILSMVAGSTTVILWKLLNIEILDGIVPGMCANFIVLILSHYMLKQEGGWVGIKDMKPLTKVRDTRSKLINQFFLNIKKFDFIEACKVNYPGGDGLIAILGVYLMFVTSSSYSNTVKLDLPTTIGYAYAFKKLYPIALCSSTCLITYPLWLPVWRETRAVGIVWNLVAFYSLICFSWLMVVISNFADTQLLIFMANVIIIFVLVKWQWTLLTVSIGITIVTFSYTNLIAVEVPNVFLLKSKMFYFLAVSSGIIALFCRKKQEYHLIEDKKARYWRNQIFENQKLFEDLLMLEYELSDNTTTLLQDQITDHVDNMNNILSQNPKFSDITGEQHMKLREIIFKNSDRIVTENNYLIALFNTDNPCWKLNLKERNFSDFINARLERNKNLYLNKKSIKFLINFDPKVIVEFDEHYMSKVVDKLISNSIIYSKTGIITVNFKVKNNILEFIIQDEGTAIPKEEIPHTFDEFIINSKLRTRGPGFTLCKKIIELHNGKISVESDGIKGSTFKFTMPLMQEKIEHKNVPFYEI